MLARVAYLDTGSSHQPPVRSRHAHRRRGGDPVRFIDYMTPPYRPPHVDRATAWRAGEDPGLAALLDQAAMSASDDHAHACAMIFEEALNGLPQHPEPTDIPF